MTHQLRVLFLGVACCAAFTACPNPRAVCGNGQVETGEACDDGNTSSGDGCNADCQEEGTGGGGGGSVGGGGGTTGGGGGSVTGGGGGSVTGGGGGSVTGGGGGSVTGGGGGSTGGGGGTIPPACTVTAGTGAFKLITGTILADTQIITDGQVLIDAAGLITCVAADCSTQAGASTATVIACPGQIVSPGLINAHDHMTYQNPPYVPAAAVKDERFEHRNNWRKGQAGHTVFLNGEGPRYTYDNSYFGMVVLDFDKETESGTKWRLTLAPERGTGALTNNGSIVHEAWVFTIPLGDLQTRLWLGQIPDWTGYEIALPRATS